MCSTDLFHISGYNEAVDIIPFKLGGPKAAAGVGGRNGEEPCKDLGLFLNAWHSQVVGFHGIKNDKHQFEKHWQENGQK